MVERSRASRSCTRTGMVNSPARQRGRGDPRRLHRRDGRARHRLRALRRGGADAALAAVPVPATMRRSSRPTGHPRHPQGGRRAFALARARGATVLGGAARAAIGRGPAASELVTGAALRRDRPSSAPARGPRAAARLGVDWPIRLTHQQVTYFATPNLAASRPTASRSGSGTAMATRSTTVPGLRRGGDKAAQDLAARGDRLGRLAARIPSVSPVARFLDAFLPGYAGPELYTCRCLYDMPPDRDFVSTGPRTPDRGLHRRWARREVREPARRSSRELTLEGGTDVPDRALPGRPPGAHRPGLRPRLPAGRCRGGDLGAAAGRCSRRISSIAAAAGERKARGGWRPGWRDSGSGPSGAARPGCGGRSARSGAARCRARATSSRIAA